MGRMIGGYWIGERRTRATRKRVKPPICEWVGPEGQRCILNAAHLTREPMGTLLAKKRFGGIGHLPSFPVKSTLDKVPKSEKAH